MSGDLNKFFRLSDKLVVRLDQILSYCAESCVPFRIRGEGEEVHWLEVKTPDKVYTLTDSRDKILELSARLDKVLGVPLVEEAS